MIQKATFPQYHIMTLKNISLDGNNTFIFKLRLTEIRNEEPFNAIWLDHSFICIHSNRSKWMIDIKDNKLLIIHHTCKTVTDSLHFLWNYYTQYNEFFGQFIWNYHFENSKNIKHFSSHSHKFHLKSLWSSTYTNHLHLCVWFSSWYRLTWYHFYIVHCVVSHKEDLIYYKHYLLNNLFD